jgi:MraZ protein
MEVSFKGTFTHTIDRKGRLSIPSELREMLPKNERKDFTVMRGLDGCLFLYPKREWERVQKRLNRLPFWKADTRRFARMLVPTAYEVKPDAQGRIVIRQALLDEARFGKEVLFLGMGDRIEIWNPRFYKKYLTEGNVTFEEAAEKVMVPREDSGD